MNEKLKYDKSLALKGIFRWQMFPNLIYLTIIIIALFTVLKKFFDFPISYLDVIKNKMPIEQIPKETFIKVILTVFVIFFVLFKIVILNIIDIVFDRQIVFKGKCIETDNGKKKNIFTNITRGGLVIGRWQYFPNTKEYEKTYDLCKDINVVTIEEYGQRRTICEYKPLKYYIRSISKDQWKDDFNYGDIVEGVCLKNSGLIIGLKIVKKSDTNLDNLLNIY